MMDNQYSVRGIRKTKDFDRINLTATIYLGHRQVGSIKDCRDSGRPIFTFELGNDRIVFEAFVNNWWGRVNQYAFYDPTTLELAHSNPHFTPLMHSKMRYWVASIVDLRRAPTSMVEKFPPRSNRFAAGRVAGASFNKAGQGGKT